MSGPLIHTIRDDFDLESRSLDDLEIFKKWNLSHFSFTVYSRVLKLCHILTDGRTFRGQMPY